MRTRAEAKILANEIAAELGKKWRGRIWKNLGWHSEARRGELYVSGGPSHINPVTHGSHYLAGSDSRGVLGSGPTPRAALLAFVCVIRKELVYAEAVLKQTRDAAELAVKSKGACPEHPKYGVMMSPRSTCQVCWNLWNAKIDLKTETVGAMLNRKGHRVSPTNDPHCHS